MTVNKRQNDKKLGSTTDFLDDLYKSGRWLSKENLDEIMEYCASLGSKRHQWVIGLCQMPMYENTSLAGFDLLEYACESAHRHGMRFDVIFKPFEGGRYRLAYRGSFPLNFPRPEGVPFIVGKKGLISGVDPFAAKNPQMQHALRPQDAYDPGGAVKAIRFIKKDADPVNIGPEDFTIWFSNSLTGENIQKYEGPVSFQNTVQYRPIPPYSDLSCRVLELGSLELPEDVAVVKVRCDAHSGPESFQNTEDSLVELVNEEGHSLPSELMPPTIPEKGLERLRRAARSGVDPYMTHPAVKPLIDDTEEFSERFRKMNLFRSSDSSRARPLGCGIGRGSEIAVMRGRETFHPGVLNPIYPQVREHWLNTLRFFTERNVDGVNIRIANHSSPLERRSYGFNEPTRAQMDNEGNYEEAERINGRAYTQFLEDAAELLHSFKKELGVHVHGLHFAMNERITGPRHQSGIIPGNIGWEWRKWISDIVDFAEFRGAFFLRPVSLARVVDRIGMAARDAKIPFIYQSSRGGGVVSFEGPFSHLDWELKNVVSSHPDITEYNLYETAGFMRLNDDGHIEGSGEFAELLRKHTGKGLSV